MMRLFVKREDLVMGASPADADVGVSLADKNDEA